MHQMELFMKHPHQVQEELGLKLIDRAKKTVFGTQYDFSSMGSMDDFKKQVPIHSYEAIFPFIEQQLKGAPDVLWPGDVKWFAKSSGTTNDKSKFIPVTKESLEDCHFKGGKDMLALYYSIKPETRLFSGKSLVVGGSTQMNQFSTDSYYGDLSGIILKNLPFWVEYRRTPTLDVALLDRWEEKIVKMAEESAAEDVTNISGVPSWTLLLLKKVLELRQKESIFEVWPNLELYMHGGISMKPYWSQYQEVLGGKKLDFLETYNASEGFFGIQDVLGSNDMLLMLDYGIFYEFVPASEWDNAQPKTLFLHQVVLGEKYELIISTNGGLWRYRIGDTIEFTSTNPYRIRVTGRTKQFINAFGEELMVHNAEEALRVVCDETHAQVQEYMVAPIFLEKGRGYHHWLVEFIKEPNDLPSFFSRLDELLRTINSDYDAKRSKNMILEPLRGQSLQKDSFYDWMKSRGKLGGQNKVPRLSNDGVFFKELQLFLNKTSI
jgi:hypothetical protein